MIEPFGKRCVDKGTGGTMVTLLGVEVALSFLLIQVGKGLGGNKLDTAHLTGNGNSHLENFLSQ